MNNQPKKIENSAVAAQLNKAGATLNKQTAFEEKVKNWFRINGTRLRTLCGSKDAADRMLIAALNTIQKVPSIMDCSDLSFGNCLLQCAEYNLMPGVTGECAIVPFKGEATFMLGYYGVCQLLYRSGMIKDIEAGIVCENDYFEYKRGSNRSLVFEPADGESIANRGKWQGAYCIIRNIFGGEHIAYMTAQEILSIKARSRGASSSYSPWNSEHDTDRAWMWMKTVLKQAAKLAPKSTKMNITAALAVDADSEETNAPAPLKIPVNIGSVSSVGGDAATQQKAALPESSTAGETVVLPKADSQLKEKSV